MFRASLTSPLALGLGGLIPFLAAGLAAILGDPAVARPAVTALIAYGAVILAFLGAVHWGLALRAGPAEPAVGLRLGLGVLPALVGWVALLLSGAQAPTTALGVLIAGFLATVLMEVRLDARSLLPSGYLRLRLGLSAAVILTLLAVVACNLRM